MHASHPRPTEDRDEHPFDWLEAEPDERAARGPQHPPCRSADEEGLDLRGHDYLGLATDKRVAGAAAAAALRWGAGATGSRYSGGSTELHLELEHELARFTGAAATAVFSSELAANVAAVAGLAGTASAIVADADAHPTLASACRLAGADVAAVAQHDPAAVAHALRTRRRKHALVVTHAVFPADGDPGPLGHLADVCRQHGAGLVVDDSHGYGVLGDGGRGGVHAAGLGTAGDVVTTVSLGTALGAQGGAVLGPRRVVRHVTENVRSASWDTSLAPSSVSAALTALGVLRAQPERAANAVAVASRLAGLLEDAGLDVRYPGAAVVSIGAPSAAEAASWAWRCAEHGVYVDWNSARLRLAARATLSESDMDKAVTAITGSAPHDAS